MMALSDFLSEKRLMNLPNWVWVGMGTAVLAYIGFKYYQSKSSASSSTTNTSSAAGTTAGVTNPTGYPIEPIYTDTNYYTNPTTPPPPSGPNIPGFLQSVQMGNYIVKGTTSAYQDPTGSGTRVSDQWPDGIAAIVYKFNNTEQSNVAIDSTMILLANPTLIPPYPVGTSVSYPLEDSQTGGFQPVRQTTSTTAQYNPGNYTAPIAGQQNVSTAR